MPQMAAAIKRLTGLHIEPEKYYLFEHRFPEVMREFGIADLPALLAELHSKGKSGLTERIVEKITTHETRFFRDESIFAALSGQIIPEWKERSAMNCRQSGYPTFRIWSAACATGQEPYSIAMELAERHPDIVKTTQIVASDISAESVARAAAGTFSDFEISRGFPEKLGKRYLLRTSIGMEINRSVLPGIEFRRLNLISDPYPEAFDIVFCRNVAYYFDRDTRAAFFQRIRKAIKPNGVLVLGSAESLHGMINDYVLREYGLARYYELNNENVSIFKRNG